MTVTVQINGTTLVPQPADTSWEPAKVGDKLDGTDSNGAYMIHILRSPPFDPATFNWDSFDNLVLTSIKTHAPGDTMRGSEVTYNSGVVSKSLRFNAPPGGVVDSVELRIAVIV